MGFNPGSATYKPLGQAVNSELGFSPLNTPHMVVAGMVRENL